MGIYVEAAALFYGMIKGTQSVLRHNPNFPGASIYGVHPPKPQPQAPNIDDAQSGARQAEDLMRQRRGVLANIYGGAGADNETAPTTAVKTALGT